MRRPYLLFLASLIAIDASAADPDAFPVEDQPTIGEETHDDANRRVVEPPERMVFSAMEFTAPDPEPVAGRGDQANRQATSLPGGDVANQAAVEQPAPEPVSAAVTAPPEPKTAAVAPPPSDAANAKAAAPAPGDDRNRAAVPAASPEPPPNVTPSVGPGVGAGAAVLGTGTTAAAPAAAPLDVPAPVEAAGEAEVPEEPVLVAEEEGADESETEVAEPEKKGFGGWVKGAAHDVGAAFTGAWAAITAKEKREAKKAAREAEEAAEAEAMEAEGTEADSEAPEQPTSIWAGAFDDERDPMDLYAVEPQAAPVPAAIGPDRIATSAAVDERPLAIPADEPPPPAAAPQTPHTVAAEVAPEPEVAEPEAREDGERHWRFEQRTLFGVKRRSGRFGAFIGWNGVRTGYAHDGTGAWGLEAGITLGPVILGAAGYGTGAFVANNHDLRFAYGGFQPGIVLWSGKLVHPRLDVLIGGGTAFETETGRTLGAASVISPRLGVELNVTRAIRLSGNLGYRFVGTPDAAVRGDFSGFEGGLSVRFGWL